MKIVCHNVIVKMMIINLMKKQHKMIIEQIFIVVKKNKKCVRFLMIYKENEEK